MQDDLDQLTAWRRHLHQMPECAFEEEQTSAFLRDKLGDWGFTISAPLARTGFVATLRRGNSERTLGLRADMDALPMQEGTSRPWASRYPGRYHACGHDGHMTMLLGAARQLAGQHNWHGTLHLIFQPAEEGKAGGRVMIEEGLFDRFPCSEVYAVHNWPALPLGTAAVGPGPMMAAGDRIELSFRGSGGHAAMPHLAPDTVVAAAGYITQAQSIVSRGLDPFDNAVVSFASIQGGSSHNIIPAEVKVVGTVRTFSSTVQDRIEARLRALAETCRAFSGVEVDFSYTRYYPATVNDPACARLAAGAAEAAGLAVLTDINPSMASEDFSFMLRQRPGAYVWLGQGDDAGHSAGLHSADYDFNDELLPLGVEFFVRLVEQRLPLAP